MSEFENVQTIENFMSNFGIVPMTTLRDEGLVSFIFTINKKKELVAKTSIITKGFADDNQQTTKEILDKILIKADELFINLLSKLKGNNINSIKSQLIYHINQYIFELTDKKPMLLPVINVIE